MTMLNIVSLAAGAVAFAMSLVALHYARQNYKQAAERQQRTRNRRHGWVPATQDLPHRAPPPAVQPGVAVEFAAANYTVGKMIDDKVRRLGTPHGTDVDPPTSGE